MAFSVDDVEYGIADADEDGRPESLMLVFPDQTLLCIADNDGDGRSDYAAVDINLTRTVDLATGTEAGLVWMRRTDAEGNQTDDQFDPEDFGLEFPGWAALLNQRFPSGVADSGTVTAVLAVVNEVLYPDWTRQIVPWSEGAIYATKNRDGDFGVLKVLKLDDVGVHIRLYGNRFDEMPTQIDESQLVIGGFDSDVGGIGHLPVSRRTFRSWKPTLVQHSTVSPDELDGFHVWEDGQGGYF